MSAEAFPLDLEQTPYAYIERPNAVLIALLEKHVLTKNPRARILDIGCGAGANAQAAKRGWPAAHWLGVEPNESAVRLAREVMDEVYDGKLADWLAGEAVRPFDAVLLSDVVEHVADPVGFLRSLVRHPATRGATFVISVPNYAVWHSRVSALFGHFRYTWSGLYDRTHLRFFTRTSLQELLLYCGFRIDDEQCTPSLVQSAAPLLRRFFEKELDQGQHRALAESAAFRAYSRLVEPTEQAVCRLWPELLGFQLVSVVRVAAV
jgi:2-polyprenyl-3-methyl-5-hydroxy-6-metoxy-1,4-benzoquinol methylase